MQRGGFVLIGVNRITIVGHLTHDPRIATLPSGSKVANLSVATNRSHKNKNGTTVNNTDYHTVAVFPNFTVEFIEKYLKKGSPVYLEGQLQYEKFVSKKSGENITVAKIVISNFHGTLISLGGKGSESESSAWNHHRSEQENDGPQRPEYEDDGIPF